MSKPHFWPYLHRRCQKKVAVDLNWPDHIALASAWKDQGLQTFVSRFNNFSTWGKMGSFGKSGFSFFKRPPHSSARELFHPCAFAGDVPTAPLPDTSAAPVWFHNVRSF